MKSIIALIIILSAQNYFSQNVRVTDYNVPVSEATTLRFDGAWNWSQSDNIVTSNHANGNILYQSFYSSLPLAWFLNLDATGGRNFAELNHNIKIDGSFRKYIFEETNWFGFSRLTAQHINTYRQIASDLSVGFGFGRYINATALAKAVRIEGHLMNDLVLDGHLPKETLINIANIIERENEFKVIYGTTYETYWFDAIEHEVLKTGMLTTDGLGSLGILRMRQVLFGINERVNERYYGWDTSIGILFPLTTEDKSAIGNPNLTLNNRYSFPISWQTQINCVAEVFTPMDSLFLKQIHLRSGVDFIYELSNRINFVSAYRLGIVKPINESALLQHNLTASFWYYIENNIYFTVSGRFTKHPNTPRIMSSSVGLQYNLF